MPRVVHFEIPADNPQRAGEFYQGVFGWKINKWEGPQPYWLCETGTGDGINGGIMNRSPQFKTVTNTIDVPSLDDYTKKVTKAGGKVVAPKMTIPGVGYLAYCTDTEGNIFSILQGDRSAK